MLSLILDYIVWFVEWLVLFGLMCLIWCLGHIAVNKILECFYIYRKDSNGQSGEEGSTED